MDCRGGYEGKGDCARTMYCVGKSGGGEWGTATLGHKGQSEEDNDVATKAVLVSSSLRTI